MTKSKYSKAGIQRDKWGTLKIGVYIYISDITSF